MKNILELNLIYKTCCDVTEIAEEAAKGIYQGRDNVQCRNLFFYFGILCGYSTTILGRFVNRDHSTVIHGNKNIFKFISISDKIILQYISEIDRRLSDNCITLSRLEQDLFLLNIENLKILRSKINYLIQQNNNLK